MKVTFNTHVETKGASQITLYFQDKAYHSQSEEWNKKNALCETVNKHRVILSTIYPRME